jgi:hypothetical protein
VTRVEGGDWRRPDPKMGITKNVSDVLIQRLVGPEKGRLIE